MRGREPLELSPEAAMAMQVSSFPCPNCAATLRLKDRRFVGKRVNCPDCGKPMQIVPDGKDAMKAQAVDASGGRGQAASAASRKGSRDRAAQGSAAGESTAASGPEQTTDETSAMSSQGRLIRWAAGVKSPVGIAWTVAVCMVLLFVMLLGPFGERQPDDSSTSAAAETAVDADPADREAAADAAHLNPETLPAEKIVDADPDDAVRLRLEGLGGQLSQYLEVHGHFPSGTVYADGSLPGERFSWLAALAAESGRSGGEPLWDRPWRDPLNERFVRRTMPVFQNPNVDQLVGPNRYPATHFVGMAGLGEDAPRLPVDHSRAGIFGIDRRTKLADIKDGASNTIMVAGVYRDPGAWAGGGPATMRPFTQEPYINGPDGFGTGQDESMLVLMADGSVRTIAGNVDPRIIRRQAAMADGLPLDPKVAGEPGQAEIPNPKSQIPNPKSAIPNPQSPTPNPKSEISNPKKPPVPAAKPIDVEGVLKQPIRSYRQVGAVPFRELLLQVEEMAGVPIRIDKRLLAGSATKLDQPVSLESENTTVGGILQALVKKAGLAYKIETDGIRVHPADR